MNVSGDLFTSGSEDVDICSRTESEIVFEGSAVSFDRVLGQSKISFDPEPCTSGFIAGNLGVSFPSDFGHWKHPRLLDVESSQRLSGRRVFSFEISNPHRSEAKFEPAQSCNQAQGKTATGFKRNETLPQLGLEGFIFHVT